MVSNSSVEVRFVGCGDAFCSGGQFQTCFVVDDDLGRIALDFGATSLVALHQVEISAASIDLIIISHLHGDHFGGLPFLLMARAYTLAAENPLTLVGPPGLREHLIALTELLYPGAWRESWPYALDIIEVAPGETRNILGRQITTWQVLHGSGTAPATGFQLNCGGKRIGFSGDSGWTETLIEIADGTDLYICECNDFVAQEFEGHLNYQKLCENRHLFNTKRLILNHMGPEMIAHRATLEIETAHDGMRVRV